MKNRNPARIALALVFVTASVFSFAAAYPKQFVGKSQLTHETIAFPSVPISALDINWRSGRVFSKTLGANSTFTFSNSVDGEIIRVYLTNTASNYTAAFPGSVKWPANTAPTLTTGAHTDEFTFTNVGGTIYGKATQNF